MQYRKLMAFWVLALIACLLGPAKLLSQPNILLIFSDDLNTRIGPYMDVDHHTPNLDELARKGVRFTRAYCQYPLCGPSRASVMSGLYPSTNGVLVNDDRPGSYRTINPALKDHPSMAGFFREQGYFTARVSKIFHMGVPGGIERGEPGGDDPESWDYAYNVMGPETSSPGTLELLSPLNLHYGGNFSRMILPDSLGIYQTDYLAASQAIAILENRAGTIPQGATNKKRIKPDAPFFLAVGFVRPHVPLIATESCFDPYPPEEVALPAVRIGENVPGEALRMLNEKRYGMDPLQQQKTISAYMASVRYMDQQVGRLLAAIDRLGLWENTINIFLSDHGYNLGEHGCWAKQSLWEGSVRVPLIISVPGLEESHGTSCSTISELIDLYPTLVGICGFGDKAPPILQGKNLARYLINSSESDPEAAAFTVSYKGDAGSLKYGHMRYTRWAEAPESGKEELYDHRTDPEEWVNLAEDPTYSAMLKAMRARFDAAERKSKSTPAPLSSDK